MENLSPKIDVVFRKLFGAAHNKDILIALINSVVTPHIVVEDIEICNPYNLAAHAGSKESILYIKARDKNDLWFNVEMQVVGTPLYGKRAIYYSAKVFVDQIEEGVPFSVLNTTIGIHFLDFTFFNDDRYFRHYMLMDTETHESCEHLSHLQFYFIEMGKFRKQSHELAAPLDRWITFLNKANALDPKNLPESLRTDTHIVKAIAELKVMGLDPAERDLYDAEVLANMIDTGQLEYVRKESRLEGRQEGRQEGLQEGLLEGEAHGRLLEGRRMLLRVGRRRFGEPTAAVLEAIDNIDSADTIELLGDRLFDVETWEHLL